MRARDWLFRAVHGAIYWISRLLLALRAYRNVACMPFVASLSGQSIGQDGP
jgi:hypothetical protein